MSVDSNELGGFEPQHSYIATVPRGLSDLLLRELQSLGALRCRERPTGVTFAGTLETGYRACLWSRVASRILLRLAEFQAPTAEDFYARAREIDWRAHVDPARTIACEFTGMHPSITNTHFGALRLKDAICDRLRADTGARPDVALVRPAVRVHAHANGSQLTLSLDMAGEGLHRRGYRIEASEAPLRENLAAGILLRARWPDVAARGGEFLDPMCGSGTFVIEAALIAAQHAPGLKREYFGFLGWKAHDAMLWQRLKNEAHQQASSSVQSIIRGSDLDQRALTIAIANAERAGVSSLLRFEHRPVLSVEPLTQTAGLICVNPPYGERLGSEGEARAAYAELGRGLREHFAGWEAAILSASPATGSELRLRNYRAHDLLNGSIPVRLLRIDLTAPGTNDREQRWAEQSLEAAASSGAQMLANRLQKNLKNLSKEARRANVQCYRLYDADMPEYAFAVDRYVDATTGEVHLHVQEYAAPPTIDAEAVRRRRREALSILPGALDVPSERIHVRVRKRQSGSEQYQRQPSEERATTQAPFTVEEGGLRFLINLDDYLDTGLFFDHRITRARLREQAGGTRFLNLFCYTASATVYAARGGAHSSLSLDLSNSYLDWATENFKLNGLTPAQHRLERVDCREWLRSSSQQFDLIFLDPPTFSNSKRMQGVLDIQRDHVEMIAQCMGLLAPGGRLVFSTNAQRFKIDPQVAQHWQLADISTKTLPFDFARNPRIHRCFEIQARQS